ncbi:MAG: polysaccharide biosynthesis tyrosine autokinase, partial [Chroococcidiopsidaceae cyanobacterium CP_BM_ER_R8_30]|nr:polysaccharide biosynthesis tyrosine autokinase [Chroococcidiopsidaceae cyanobacterium CP_BM_ER_R8_30]
MRSAETIDLDFQNLWALLKRRWLPAISVFSTVLAIAIIADLLQKPVYQAQGKLLLKKVDQTSALTGLGEKIGQLNGVNLEKSDPLKTEAEVLVSTPLLQETINLLNLKDKKGKLLKPEKLAQQLKVKQLPEADVLQTSYKSTNPREAAAVVNTLMNIYIENNVLTNRAEAVAAARFINNQLPETETTVRQAELALRLFKEQNHVIDLDEESKSAVAVIQELQTQINQTQVELAGANAKLADLQNKVGRASQQAITINSLNQSAGVQKVLEEFQRVESELALQRTRFQEDYPTIVDLRLKETALRALLQNRVERDAGPARPIPSEDLQIGESKQKLLDNLVISESDRSSLVSRLAKLYEAQSIYKQRVNILPKLEQEQRELKRQVEAAQSTYETLLKKLQEVRVAENQNMGNARIIESALVPEKASIRNKILILGLGCMLGILLSGATVAILEVTDTSIKTLEQARELFGYTLVGVIPSLKKKATHRGKATEWTVPELPVRDTPHLPICEAYRMLQANLKFLSSDKALKVIVVTSSVPNEGKSKVSANLVATMAQLGRRVLLVDADMRHPTQHHIWGLTNAVGLSDVIIGQCEFEVAVKEVMANLDVLPSGGIPPSPLALLDSKRMASLIENFAKTYDFVALDAPPLTVADALTLGKMTDGVLLLARLGVVDFTSAATAKRTLECLGQNVLGLVVNDVNLE